MSLGQSHSRRRFLTSLFGVGSAMLAGCSGLVPRDPPPYQIVGGVESTLIRGVREGTNRKVAETVPIDSSVVDSAPTELDLRTVAYDTAVVDLSGDGRMELDAETAERIRDGYDDSYGVVVLTLYNDDPHSKIPKGNSYGYLVPLGLLMRMTPGNRVSATVATDRDVVAIDELLAVDSATE